MKIIPKFKNFNHLSLKKIQILILRIKKSIRNRIFIYKIKL